MAQFFKDKVPLRMTVEVEWEETVSFYKDAVEGEGISGAFIAEQEVKDAIERGVLTHLYSSFGEEKVTSIAIEVLGSEEPSYYTKNKL